MNERIKQLAEQAGVKFTNYGSGDFIDDGDCGTYHLQKFAELIVRECAKICIERNVSNLDLDVIHESGKFTLQDLATKSCGENLSKQIKKHFGVEQ